MPQDAVDAREPKVGALLTSQPKIQDEKMILSLFRRCPAMVEVKEEAEKREEGVRWLGCKREATARGNPRALYIMHGKDASKSFFLHYFCMGP